MRRVLTLTFMGFVAAAMLYISRFWDFRLWGRDGLFGLSELRPQGGLLARWLRGTDFAPFELLIWVVAGFLLLTVLQRAFDALSPPAGDDDDT